MKVRQDAERMRSLVDGAAGLPWSTGEDENGDERPVVTTSLRDIETDDEGPYYELGGVELEALVNARRGREFRGHTSRLAQAELEELTTRASAELERDNADGRHDLVLSELRGEARRASR